MADLSISNESKNSLSISNESKSSVGTWATWPTRTWADGGTWGEPGTFIQKDSKNSLTITNEDKP